MYTELIILKYIVHYGLYARKISPRIVSDRRQHVPR